MVKPLGSNRIMVIRSSYGDVTGNDIGISEDSAIPTYNGINAGTAVDTSRRQLNYGSQKPVNSDK